MSLRIVVTLAAVALVALTANACAWMGCIDNPCRANGGSWVENDDEKCGGHCDYPDRTSSSSSGSWYPGPSTTDASTDGGLDANGDALEADAGESDAGEGDARAGDA